MGEETRLVTVGGSHVEYRLRFEGGTFTGTLALAITPQPVGMLRSAPPQMAEALADRGRPRKIFEGTRAR